MPTIPEMIKMTATIKPAEPPTSPVFSSVFTIPVAQDWSRIISDRTMDTIPITSLAMENGPLNLTGCPHFGHDFAVLEISAPHSWQYIADIIVPSFLFVFLKRMDVLNAIDSK